ncbi:MAG: threonylcarbamoyl-AMP synthase [Candidatus Melainabacteria bacterium GWF2_32_7]|nr:MAG: threonylcarbamoyl-AMP synthase [Candidatus Melainabacteria bacterium GWF2_32_7]
MYNFQLSHKEIIKIHNSLEKKDGVIAFPTDTVWGIGCLIDNELAVDRIYSIKGRSENKPLILLGSKIEHLVPYVAEIPEIAWKIIDKYLPGAVTLVLKKSENTPFYLTSGGDTIGIRIPDCPPFLSLLDNAVENHVLATTSANLSGEPAALSKSEAEGSIGDKVDYILDDYGYSAKGTESTVVLVDLSGNIKILRQGAIAIDV